MEAGAELREGFTVDEVVTAEGTVTGIRGHARGAPPVTERAPVVIGADGRHSLVAKTARSEQYDERPSHVAMYYAYWSDLPATGFDEFAQLRPPPPEMQQLLGAMRGDQEAMDAFVSVQAGRLRIRSSSTRGTSAGSWRRPPRAADLRSSCGSGGA